MNFSRLFILLKIPKVFIMKRKFFIYFLFFFSILLITNSCYHKNVSSSNADDINKVIYYQGENLNYLIFYELIFQANSKSTGYGITQVRGHYDTRISVYNTLTGELIVRKKMHGFTSDEALKFFTVSDNRIWIYSLKSDLQVLKLETLENDLSKEEIFKNCPELINKIVKPEHTEIHNYFGFDPIQNKILITDNEGFKYSLNPESLEINRIDDNREMSSSFSDKYLGTRANYYEYKINIEGDIRNTIFLNSIELNSEISFLSGEIILDKNPTRIFNYLSENNDFYQKQLDDVNAKIEALIIKYGNDFVARDRKINEQIRKLEKGIHKIDQKLDIYKSDFEEMQNGNYHFVDDLPLKADSTSFFIVHKNNIDKNARLKISKLKLEFRKSLTVEWNIQIDDVFFNCDDAKETNEYKNMFKKGHPSFGFQYFELFDNKLFVIYMLHAFCIDVNSGEVLWKFRI